MQFDSVIIDNVEIKAENRMAEKGPIGATLNVTFSTYQMLTREKLEGAYLNKSVATGKDVESYADLSGR